MGKISRRAICHHHLLFLFMVVLVVALTGVTGLAAELQYQIENSPSDDFADSDTAHYPAYYSFGVPSGATRAYLRWPVKIPKGATITSAKVSVNATLAAGTPGTARIRLIDSDDCPKFAANPYNLPVTGSYVDWTTGPWTVNQWYDTSDISSLIQEFIARPGYQYGQMLGLRFEYLSGAGNKRIKTWDLNPAQAPILTVNYTGGEAVIVLHMADPEVRVDQKIYCELANLDPSYSLQAELDQTVFASINAPLSDEEVVVADYRNLLAGQHTLTIRILDAQQNDCGSVSRTWTTLHDGIPLWGIDQNNAICNNGEPYFPITSWLLTYDRFNTPIAGTINTVLGMAWYASYTISTWQHYLTTGTNAGFHVAGPVRWDGFNGSDPTNSDTQKLADYVVATRSGYPGLMFWNWDDEPELGGSMRNYAVRDWTELTHSLDTNHPVYINYVGYHFSNYDVYGNSIVKQYCYNYNRDTFGKQCLSADILSFDYYCYEYATKWTWCNLEDNMSAFDNLRLWNRNLAPVMSFIETQDVYGPTSPYLLWDWTPGPTTTQLNNLLWLTVIHNAKGLSWYHHHTTTPAENIDVLAQFMSDIELLTPIVLGPEETDYDVTVSLAGQGRVDHMVRVFEDSLWIFAASTRPDDETATFNVPSLQQGATVYVYGEGRSITAGDGFFVDDFGELDVHIYMIDLVQPVDVEYQIAASLDDTDCNQWHNSPTSQYLHWPYCDDLRRSFMRWPLDIPAGSTINSAHLEVQANYHYSSASAVRLQAIDSDNCPPFASTPYLWAVAAGNVDWTLDPWVMNNWYSSPDLADMVQSFVDRPGYAAGNYFALRSSYLSGAWRRCWQYDYAPSSAAVLVINYTPPAP